MRYSASEKFEIIELVEQSSLSIRRTLAPIGIPRSTFYDWYSRYQEGGIEDSRYCIISEKVISPNVKDLTSSHR